MRKLIGGKTYNTETMTVIVDKPVYHNGNYCGSDTIRKTKSGNFAFVRSSNGQDLYRNSDIRAITKDDITDLIDGWVLDDKEQQALIDLGIATEA